MSTADKKLPRITVTEQHRSSEDSSETSIKNSSLRSPRAARFAEATTVHSPIEPSEKVASPFDTPPSTNHFMAQPQVSDVGFGYMNKHESVEMPNTDVDDYPPTTPRTLPKTPLKSAMKTPGAAPRDFGNILSPTFKEEEHLEKREKHTEIQQAKDLKWKVRVRIAKFLLRGANFSCSLIVLSMLSYCFTIFNATKHIPPRNNLPPWAQGQQTWPQITLLCISCVSLAFSVFVLYGYSRGGHKRAQRVAAYYQAFAVAFFIFSILMWGIGAGILQGSKANGNNHDFWGWSCVQNQRHELFQDQIQYDLICTLQNWSLMCCIIEVVVETITIAVYAVAFWRFWSKRRLRKSMANRDRARSDLYLAQLRSQSAPNTPGVNGPYSARDGAWRPPMTTADYFKTAPSIEEGDAESPVQYVDASQVGQPKPFQLQPPPVKSATPKLAQVGFATTAPAAEPMPPPSMTELDPRSPLPLPLTSPREQRQEHFYAAPGERVYEDVPIPGAYETPMSPTATGRTPVVMTFPQSPR